MCKETCRTSCCYWLKPSILQGLYLQAPKCNSRSTLHREVLAFTCELFGHKTSHSSRLRPRDLCRFERLLDSQSSGGQVCGFSNVLSSNSITDENICRSWSLWVLISLGSNLIFPWEHLSTFTFVFAYSDLHFPELCLVLLSVFGLCPGWGHL